MSETLIIYPNDPSTHFLLDSFCLLQKDVTNLSFYEILPSDESHRKCLNLIEKHHSIIFMGHGSHSKISGAKDENYTKDIFLSIADIKDLGKKNWLLFSCNSNDLLKKCSPEIISGIGFGDLPTDFNDIQGIREFEQTLYKNISIETIECFKKSINWIITESIYSYSSDKLSFRELYNRINLLINKCMIDILKDSKNDDLRGASKLLYDMKCDAQFY